MLIQEHKSVVDIVVHDELVGQIIFKAHPNFPGIVEVHNTMYKWSSSIYKQGLIVWAQLCSYLKEHGATKVVTCCNINRGDQPPKYWIMFGFDLKGIRTFGGVDYWYAELEL